MSHSLSSVVSEASRRPDDHGHPPRGRPPVVERTAGWNARPRKTALPGWLVMATTGIRCREVLEEPRRAKV